ncbi:MAG TPA: CHASE3 domain-containing protein, partial [Candidatus Polarisedimenticolaceae bacterium]|nr:CHASE3 domain-containing protein [Candidatus Polarisedimenticolaceae bacterium]
MVRPLLKSVQSKPLITSLLVVIMLTLVMVVSSGFVVYRYITVNQSLQQSLDYNASLGQLFSEIRNAEANQREYLLTGNEHYLANYYQAIASARNRLQPLRGSLTEKQYAQISRLTDARVAYLGQAVDSQKGGDHEAALAIVRTGEGKRVMDQLQAQISDLLQQKSRQIEHERAAVGRLSGLVMFGIAAGTLLCVLLIGFAVRLALALEKKERDLRRSQSALQSIVDYAPNYIQMLDLDLKRSFINRAGTERTSGDLLIGRKFGEFMDKSERQRVRRILRRVIKTGRSTDLEFITHLGGSSQWYKNSVGPIYSGEDITGLVLITFDVSRERQARKHLEEQKKKAEAERVQAQILLNSIGEGLLVIDEHGV